MNLAPGQDMSNEFRIVNRLLDFTNLLAENSGSFMASKDSVKMETGR